uniref:Extended FMRFamide n=1 Tax=Carabus violaceus TaxID=41075 RepID=A0A7U3MC94_CARVO|nr:extended FMRFamide [Carabus violaceus]
MRCWIIFVSLVNMNFMFSMAENIGNELSDDERDDSIYLYVDERSVQDASQDKKDVETRSRSTLDKNFLRFGRSGRDFYAVQDRPYDLEDMDYLDEFVRPARGAYDNYVRFGRGKASDYIRFGRDPYKYANREIRSNNDKNRIRFGRSVAVKRSRRDVSDNYEEQKRQRNMVRFGRNDKSMPNDRSTAYKSDNEIENYEEQKRQRNMVRFGRNDNSFGRIPMHEADSQSDNQNGSQATKEHLATPFYPINIVPLLKQLAARLRSENNCFDCSRFG